MKIFIYLTLLLHATKGVRQADIAKDSGSGPVTVTVASVDYFPTESDVLATDIESGTEPVTVESVDYISTESEILTTDSGSDPETVTIESVDYTTTESEVLATDSATDLETVTVESVDSIPTDIEVLAPELQPFATAASFLIEHVKTKINGSIQITLREEVLNAITGPPPPPPPPSMPSNQSANAGDQELELITDEFLNTSDDKFKADQLETTTNYDQYETTMNPENLEDSKDDDQSAKPNIIVLVSAFIYHNTDLKVPKLQASKKKSDQIAQLTESKLAETSKKYVQSVEQNLPKPQKDSIKTVHAGDSEKLEFEDSKIIKEQSNDRNEPDEIDVTKIDVQFDKQQRVARQRRRFQNKLRKGSLRSQNSESNAVMTGLNEIAFRKVSIQRDFRTKVMISSVIGPISVVPLHNRMQIPLVSFQMSVPIEIRIRQHNPYTSYLRIIDLSDIKVRQLKVTNFTISDDVKFPLGIIRNEIKGIIMSINFQKLLESAIFISLHEENIMNSFIEASRSRNLLRRKDNKLKSAYS